ncbi:MAG: LysR family transcriptional regulator [Faecousia sp.]
MDIQILKEFCVVAKVLNYTDAAEELYISQSSLYKHIKSLEGEINEPLFKKLGKHLALTKYGEMLIPYAEQILDLQERYLEDVQDAQQEDDCTLEIVTGYKITELIRDFNASQDSMVMVKEIKGGEDQLAISKDFDVAIMCDLQDPENKYDSFCLWEEEMAVALPHGHPFSRRESLSLKELKHEKFITVSTWATREDMTTKLFLRRNFHPKVVMNGISGTEVASLVAQGLGVAVLNRRSIEMAMPGVVDFVSLNPPYKFPVSICWRKGKPLSPIAQRFIDFARNYDPKCQLED